MKKILLSVIALITLGVQGQSIFKEDFSTLTVGSQLSGQGTWSNNSSNPGGTGAAGGALPDNAKVIATASSYTGYGTSVNSVQIKPSDGCGRGFTAVSSGDVYIAFVLNLTNAYAVNNSDFFRVMSSNNFNSALRITATPSAGAFFLSTEKNTGTRTTTALSYGYNQDHLVVIKYTIGSGANDDIITLYVDPVFANGEPATYASINNSGSDYSGAIGLDRFCIRQNGNSAAMPLGKMGLVSVSTTWSGLSFLNLANDQFNAADFSINASDIKSGNLSIKSNLDLNNAVISIYDLQGRMIDQKTTNLSINENNISLNTITNSGVYILEITSDKSKYSQKIMVK